MIVVHNISLALLISIIIRLNIILTVCGSHNAIKVQ